MSKRYKVALAGCGGMGRYWTEMMSKIPEVELCGFMDICKESADALVSDFQIPNAYTTDSIDDLLGYCKPDILIDASMPGAHKENTIKALRAGVNVLGEKPISENLADALEMVRVAEESGRVYAVMQNRRYDKNIRRFKDFIHSGAIGEVNSLYADFFTAPRFEGFRLEMDHVLLLDMAIHHFDAARYILQDEAVSVQCTEWNPKGSIYKDGASICATFRMKSGVVFNYRGSWWSEGYPTTWECQWRAVAGKGSSLWDGANEIKAEKLDSEEGFNATYKRLEINTQGDGKDGGHHGCFLDFLRCLDEGVEPETIARDNLKSLIMVFGSLASIKHGKTIMVEDLMKEIV